MSFLKVPIIIGLLFEFFYIYLWFGCRELKNQFYYSLYDVQLILQDHIHNDAGVPLLLTRIVHNKVTLSIFEAFRHYLYYWDFQFLINLLSPVGLFGICVGLWYVYREKMKSVYKIIVFALLFFVPMIIMFAKPSIPFLYQILILSLPYVALSGYGLVRFLDHNSPRRLVLITILILVSVAWLSVFHKVTVPYCTF